MAGSKIGVSELEAALSIPSSLSYETPRVDPQSEPTIDLKALQQLDKPAIRAILKDLLTRENELRLASSVPAHARAGPLSATSCTVSEVLCDHRRGSPAFQHLRHDAPSTDV